jgi:hypothetical protein
LWALLLILPIPWGFVCFHMTHKVFFINSIPGMPPLTYFDEFKPDGLSDLSSTLHCEREKQRKIHNITRMEITLVCCVILIFLALKADKTSEFWILFEVPEKRQNSTYNNTHNISQYLAHQHGDNRNQTTSAHQPI